MALTERDLEALDPLKVDREIAEAARALSRDARALRTGQADPSNPFFSQRLVATRTAFHAVSHLSMQDPLREPLRRWIYRLAEHRIDRAVMVRAAHERYVEEHVISEPLRTKIPLSRMMERALSEPRRARAWLDSFLRSSEKLGGAESVLWERRREVASRMGLSGPDEIEAPGTSGVKAAHAFIDRTTDALAGVVGSDVENWLHVGLGREAREGFPRHLLPRTILDFFRGTDLFRSVDLDPGRLPLPFAPASFVRALLRVGAAWVDATAPRDQPFVIAHDPYGLRRRTIGALFGLLPAAAPFARRALGVDASRMSSHLRALSGLLLVGTRLAALRVVLRSHALEGRRSLQEAYEEETRRVLLTPLPGTAAGALIRLHVDDVQRFAGILLASALAERLREEHDEDWYRNPRAIERLRDDARLSPPATTTDEALALGERVFHDFIVRHAG